MMHVPPKCLSPQARCARLGWIALGLGIEAFIPFADLYRYEALIEPSDLGALTRVGFGDTAIANRQEEYDLRVRSV